VWISVKGGHKCVKQGEICMFLLSAWVCWEDCEFISLILSAYIYIYKVFVCHECVSMWVSLTCVYILVGTNG
jgi:hypothetical protein